MAIDRKWIAQDENDCNQWLKIDHSSRYIINHSPEWQPIFNTNSTLSNSSQVLKLAAQLDTNTLDKIRMIGYLYNPVTGTIDSAAGVTFSIYKVVDITTPKWDDQLITSVGGIFQSNSYYFKDILISALTGANLDGDTTLMIEGVATRLGITYRDRIYVNHLGVYDSIIRLRNDVEFLDVTKLDE
jgi:hypothetical protein